MKRMLAVTRRPWLSAAVGLSLLVTTAACSSESAGTATATPSSAAAASTGPSTAEIGESSADSEPTDEADAETSEEASGETAEAPSEDGSESDSGDSGTGDSGSGDSDSGDSGSGDTSGICGLISPYDVNGVVGVGHFTTTSDVSVDGQACLYLSGTDTHSVTISVDSLDVYLGGDVAGDTDADSLANWASAQEIFVSDAVTTPITVGGVEAAQVTGKSSILDTPVGYAGLILDGKIISVTAEGAKLSEDPAELGGFAAAVLEVALAKLG